MPATTKAPKAKLSVITNHDYLSLVTPKGRFTAGRYGYKGSGNVTGNVFDSFVNHVERERKTKNLGQVFSEMLDGELLETIWPNWNVAEVNPFKVDDLVRFTDARGRKKYGVGRVIRLAGRGANKGLEVVVKFETGDVFKCNFKMVEAV